MTNDKLLRGYRYYMKFGGPKDDPVNATIKLLKRPPKDGATWRDVTACLKVCCNTDTVTADDFSVAMTSSPKTGNVITESGAVSSRGNTITTDAYSYTVNGVTIAILTNGNYTLTGTGTLTTTIILPITFTDTQNVSTTVKMTITVNLP